MSEKKKKRHLLFSPESKLRLIELIESHPLILERPIKRVYEREQLWADIGRELGRSAADCKLAWKWLRRQYVLSLKSNSSRKRGQFIDRLKFLSPYLEKQKRRTLVTAASSSANISVINKEGPSTTPTVIKASTSSTTNRTITTDGEMSPCVLIPTIIFTQQLSITSTASTPLSSKISNSKEVSQSYSTTSTSRTKLASNTDSELTAINNSTSGTSPNDIKVSPLLLVPLNTQENKSENLNTFIVTQDIIQQLLKSKEKEEKQSDMVDDNKCITIDEGFIENPFNNQTTTTLSSDSCKINKNNMSTDPVNYKSLPMDEIGEHNVLVENLTSAQTMSGEIKKQDNDSTFHSEPAEDNDYNIRVKNYFLYMAGQLAGLPRYVQEDICLNISDIIDQARNKHLNN